ncbi:MAG TPA: menaquinone biosynthesis protein [Ktedonobacterales bacterium]
MIDYLNVAPVYDWLRHPEWRDGPGTQGVLPGNDSGVELVAGVPSVMNAALAAGAIDVSNVSSVAFGEHAREWLLLPDLSVAAHGRVASVLLFSRHRDWSALDGGSVAVTSDSATSVALVRLLCERRYGVSPRLVSRPPDLDAMLAAHDAALLIGDIALREGQARRPIGGAVPYIFDLAAEWQAWTGLPFVFSVWAARRDRAEAIRQGGVLELLRTSTDWGLAHLDIIAADAARRLNLPLATCAAYLRLLDYALTERDLRGLRAFLELAVPGFAWEDVRWL